MDIAAKEFPFVEALPKREAKRALTLWEAFKEFLARCEEHGPLIQPSLAAELLGVSKQRVGQLMDDGRFQIIEDPRGTRLITGKSFVDFCHQERKSGRPTKLDTGSTVDLVRSGLVSLKK